MLSSGASISDHPGSDFLESGGAPMKRGRALVSHLHLFPSGSSPAAVTSLFPISGCCTTSSPPPSCRAMEHLQQEAWCQHHFLALMDPPWPTAWTYGNHLTFLAQALDPSQGQGGRKRKGPGKDGMSQWKARSRRGPKQPGNGGSGREKGERKPITSASSRAGWQSSYSHSRERSPGEHRSMKRGT